jgi:hypothetical protein
MDTARNKRLVIVATLAVTIAATGVSVVLLLVQPLARVARTLTPEEALTITRKSNPETAEIQSNIEIRDWMGWVTMIETGKADGGATVGVYLSDPYAVEPTPVITSPFISLYPYPTQGDAFFAIPEDEIHSLSVGDQIRFSGTIPELGPTPNLIIDVQRYDRLGPEPASNSRSLPDMTITLERSRGGYDIDCCQDYLVRIMRDGSLRFKQREWNGQIAYDVEAKLSKDQMLHLAFEVERAQFFYLQSVYPPPASDHSPGASISVQMGERYNSSAFSLSAEHPHARRLYILAAKVDEIINVKQWRKQE